MLKWYAELFKFSGKELTPKALIRVKALMLLSLPAYPATTAKLGQFGGNLDLLLNIISVVSVLCFLAFACTKFVNRFWSRDKYLDEWERARKHEAMAFAFQVVMYTLSLVLLLGVINIRLALISITFPTLGLYGMGVIAGGVFWFGLYVMHGYMLFTTEPMIEDKSDNSLYETNLI